MSVLKQAIEAHVHNYGHCYETRQECIEKMNLHFYAQSGTPWVVDPEIVKTEGHTPIPKNEWKNYDDTPCAIFFEEDKSEGRAYVKYIFHLKI